MRVSIAVPVYNKSKYLKRCIDSILGQTYKDIELILIDDGSTDDSLTICNKYKKDKRVIVISQENKGVSAARNAGIKRASGKYIMFVDADDYVNEDYVREFLKYDDDLVVSGYISSKTYFLSARKISNINTMLSRKFSKFVSVPYAKMFKLSIIKKNHILFDETMNFGEDTCFVLDYIANCNIIRFINYVGYHNEIIENTLSRIYVSNIETQLNNIYSRIRKLTGSVRIRLYWYIRNKKIIKNNRIKRKRVGIITLGGNNNYGNRLQNYALSKVVNNFGYDVSTIRIIGYNDMDKSFAKYIRCKYLFALKQCFVNGFIRTYKFKKFNKNIPFYRKEISSIANLDKINDDFDYFITGSDQVWNYRMAEPISVYFLNWADKKKRISYAASFGFDEVPKKLEKKYKELTKGMNKVSVRERTAAKIVEKMTGDKDVEVLADPTLLISADEWALLEKRPTKFDNIDGKKYIINFFLGGMDEIWKNEIQKIADKYDYAILNLLDKKDSFYNSDPAEFLYLINNAKLVCTDSFHASVFSFIFNKPFVVFKRRGGENYMYSRIQNLMNTFKLNNREFNDSGLTKQNLAVDYSAGKKILEKERKKSLEFLREALGGKDV